MPSPDVLESAGRRAAFRRVPAPQPMDALAAEVSRRRSKKRQLVGGALAALVALIAIPFGVALVSGDNQPDVVTLASEGDGGDDVSGDPVAVQPADTSSTTTTAPENSDDSVGDAVGAAPFGPFAGLDGDDLDLSIEFGDLSFAIEIIGGDSADERAAEAKAAADETRDVDGQSVWIDNRGDDIAASAFFEDEATFVQVVGPADQIEKLLDLVVEHADGPVRFFDHNGFAERFDLPEGIFEDDFTFDEDFPFGPESPFGPEGPFGEDFPFDMDSFFDEGALEDFRKEMDDFSECMDITVDRSGATTKIEIPDCDFPKLDGLFEGGIFESELFDNEAFKDLPKDLEELFEDLETES